MLSRLSIRQKLYILAGMLTAVVALLAFSSFQGVYAYRWLAKSVSHHSGELPLAAQLAQRVSDLRASYSRARYVHELEPIAGQPLVEAELVREEFRSLLLPVREALGSYRARLAANEEYEAVLGDREGELGKIGQIERELAEISQTAAMEDWLLDSTSSEELNTRLEKIAAYVAELPGFLRHRMHAFAGDVRVQYRWWIIIAWVGAVGAIVVAGLLGALFYYWVFRPLRILIKGSRRVAEGDFDHRIDLDTRDEMAELAEAVNEMTRFFKQTNDELNEQVRERTREVVRSEQLASVGFLAAGVAHEINNPLAAIAWAAESLEGRVDEIIQADDLRPDQNHSEEIAQLREYLRRIQDEAYRCKGITEKLLSFSRLGDMEKHDTDLRELVQEVVDVVRHVGKYKEKRVVFEPGPAVVAPVNPPELKQVVLNLITNGLDSLEAGGQVTVRLSEDAERAELVVADNGCGMCREVLENLYEPFFTRRRDGSGTGLGLSISFRIITDHGGQIQAASDGPGRGSQFRVTLPLVRQESKEHAQRRQAA